MLLIDLDRKSVVPLFKQVYSQIKRLIDEGHMKEGEILPSSRRFAEQLGVNRTTICKAYDELWALGYINAKAGSYSRVRKPYEKVTKPAGAKERLIKWENEFKDFNEFLLPVFDKYSFISTKDDLISFTTLSPDPRLMPVDDFRKCMNKALRKEGVSLFQYGDPNGYLLLREFITKRMCLHSMNISVDEILMTNGTQNALELIMKLFTKKGDKIVIATPTYSWAIPLFRFYKTEIVEVPISGEGMDLESLESIITKEKPRFIYTMPNFHNPTGLTTSKIHREKFLQICEKHRTPIVEDGFEEEMKYFGKAVAPIKSMDEADIVIYLGTFSKILFPGLRLGWIAANRELLEKLKIIKQVSEITSSLVNQAALYQFCISGYYDKHIGRNHRTFRKRMQVALKAVRDYLPEEICEYNRPMGGYTIWIELKDRSLSEDKVLERISKHGAAVTPGKIFYTKPNEKSSFRISIAQLNEDEIKEGIKRIGAALKSLSKKNGEK